MPVVAMPDGAKVRFPDAMPREQIRDLILKKFPQAGKPPVNGQDFAPKPGDIVAHEHWSQSGFANTDLDLRLKQKGITHVILIGLLANTCIESTGRYAMELGYHVTLVRDATAAFKPEMMHAAHELNGPTFAHAIRTTAELIAVLPSRSVSLRSA